MKMKTHMVLICSIKRCNAGTITSMYKLVGHNENGTQKLHSGFITEMAKRLSSHTHQYRQKWTRKTSQPESVYSITCARFSKIGVGSSLSSLTFHFSGSHSIKGDHNSAWGSRITVLTQPYALRFRKR